MCFSTYDKGGTFASVFPAIYANIIVVKPNGDPNVPGDILTIVNPTNGKVFPGHTHAPPLPPLASTGTWRSPVGRDGFVIDKLIHLLIDILHQISFIETIPSFPRVIPQLGPKPPPFKIITIEHDGPHPVDFLLVSLASFETETEGKDVIITWKTGAEKDNESFVVWRGEPLDGQCSSDNPDNYINVITVGSSVKSKGSKVSGATYKVRDKGLKSGKYCYALEDRDYNGKRTFHMNKIVSAVVD